MNAKEAREQALSMSNEHVNAQYVIVKKRIEASVKASNLSCSITDMTLKDAVRQQLEREGFKVASFHDQRDGSWIVISW
jgi:predicted ribonuclease YlaK